MLDVSPSNWLNYKSTLVTPDKGCLYTNVNLKSSRNRFRIYEWVQNGKVKVIAYGMQHGGMHFSSYKDLMADSGLVAISISLSLCSEPFSVAYFLGISFEKLTRDWWFHYSPWHLNPWALNAVFQHCLTFMLLNFKDCILYSVYTLCVGMMWLHWPAGMFMPTMTSTRAQGRCTDGAVCLSDVYW